MEARVPFPEPGRGDLGAGRGDACVREWPRGCVLFKFPEFDVEPLQAEDGKRAVLYPPLLPLLLLMNTVYF